MNAAAYGGLVRAHIALGELDQAEAILNGAPAEISKAPSWKPPTPSLNWRGRPKMRARWPICRPRSRPTPDDHAGAVRSGAGAACQPR